ncbi:MAG: cytochrome C [bacterium]|nr:cytochrome C [bacterium]
MEGRQIRKREEKSGGLIEKLIPGPVLQRERRIIIGILILLSAALIFFSFFLPFWNFTLHAPQYPEGLHLKLYLNKVKGEVMEVDILNHYIGMKKLEEAAKFERKIAFWGVLLLSLGMLGFVFSGRKSMTLFSLLPIVFLIAFVGDLFFWLYKYGHDLDPAAPIKIEPFTPKIFGKGKVGQFETVASFGAGFYMILLAFVFSISAFFLRVGVCNACPAKEKCSVVCSSVIRWKAKPEDYERVS